jgi:hypothetical protein
MSSKIFDHKIVNVEKVKELESGFDLARFTFDDGDTIEAVVKYADLPTGGESQE